MVNKDKTQKLDELPSLSKKNMKKMENQDYKGNFNNIPLNLLNDFFIQAMLTDLFLVKMLQPKKEPKCSTRIGCLMTKTSTAIQNKLHKERRTSTRTAWHSNISKHGCNRKKHLL